MSQQRNKKLTKRELQVLQLVSEGKSNIDIAQDLNISYYTVKAHVSTILYKLEVSDRLKASLKALKSGLIE